jgi:hypothetical protein
MTRCPLSCTGVPVTWTPAAVTQDRCTCSCGSLRLSRVTPAPVNVNGPAVLRDTRGCSRGQAHPSSMTGAPARDVSRAVPRNRSIWQGGQVHPSTMTPGHVSVSGPRVSVIAARVPRDGCGCHHEQMRLLRMTPAVVLVGRCLCYARRSGCLHGRMRESADASAVCLVDGARAQRHLSGSRRARLRASRSTVPLVKLPRMCYLA